ncbi:MAG: hypothetical protein WCF18_25405 [Chthoniobacteraceae bacterium]
MGLFSKPPKKSAPAKATPLTAKQRALLEEEQRVKAEMERCTRFVKDAPERARKIQREQRDELIRRASTMHRGGGTTKVVDRRFEIDANVAAPVHRKTRAERRQGRLMFFILLLALAGSIFYFYYTVTHG